MPDFKQRIYTALVEAYGEENMPDFASFSAQMDKDEDYARKAYINIKTAYGDQYELSKLGEQGFLSEVKKKVVSQPSQELSTGSGTPELKSAPKQYEPVQGVENVPVQEFTPLVPQETQSVKTAPVEIGTAPMAEDPTKQLLAAQWGRKPMSKEIVQMGKEQAALGAEPISDKEYSSEYTEARFALDKLPSRVKAVIGENNRDEVLDYLKNNPYELQRMQRWVKDPTNTDLQSEQVVLGILKQAIGSTVQKDANAMAELDNLYGTGEKLVQLNTLSGDIDKATDELKKYQTQVEFYQNQYLKNKGNAELVNQIKATKGAINKFDYKGFESQLNGIKKELDPIGAQLEDFTAKYPNGIPQELYPQYQQLAAQYQVGQAAYNDLLNSPAYLDYQKNSEAYNGLVQKQNELIGSLEGDANYKKALQGYETTRAKYDSMMEQYGQFDKQEIETYLGHARKVAKAQDALQSIEPAFPIAVERAKVQEAANKLREYLPSIARATKGGSSWETIPEAVEKVAGGALELMSKIGKATGGIDEKGAYTMTDQLAEYLNDFGKINNTVVYEGGLTDKKGDINWSDLPIESLRQVGNLAVFATVGRFTGGSGVQGMVGSTVAKNSPMVATAYFMSRGDRTKEAEQAGLKGTEKEMYVSTLSLLEGLSELIMPDNQLFTKPVRNKLLAEAVEGVAKGKNWYTKQALATIVENGGKEGAEELVVKLGELLEKTAINYANGNVFDVEEYKNYKEWVATALVAAPLAGVSTAIGQIDQPTKQMNADLYRAATDMTASREVLDVMVDKGKLTAEQADKVYKKVVGYAALKDIIPQDISPEKAVELAPIIEENETIKMLLKDADDIFKPRLQEALKQNIEKAQEILNRPNESTRPIEPTVEGVTESVTAADTGSKEGVQEVVSQIETPTETVAETVVSESESNKEIEAIKAEQQKELDAKVNRTITNDLIEAVLPEFGYNPSDYLNKSGEYDTEKISTVFDDIESKINAKYEKQLSEATESNKPVPTPEIPLSEQKRENKQVEEGLNEQGVGGGAGTSLRGVKYSDIIVDDKYLEDILSDNKLSEEEKKQVREVFARAVDYFKFDKEGEQKFQEKFANPEDITDVADIITGLSAAQQSAFNFYNTKNYENVKDALNYIANNPNEYSPKVVKAVKEIKQKLDNPSSSMSRLYAIDVMKELGISVQSLKETPKAETVKQEIKDETEKEITTSEVAPETGLQQRLGETGVVERGTIPKRIAKSLGVDNKTATQIHDIALSAKTYEEFKKQVEGLLGENTVNENRIAEQYDEIREEAKSEYEKQIERNLEDLRAAYTDATKADTGLRRMTEKSPKTIRGFIKRILNPTTTETVAENKARLVEMQRKYRKEKADMRALLPRERGSNFIIEKLSRAARNGDIDQETADLAIDLLRKQPSLFADLAISITAKTEDNGVQGWYRAADALVKIFKNPSDPTTAVHELLHHTERFLPHEVRDKIIAEWSNEVNLQISAIQKKLKTETNPEIRDALTQQILYLGLALERQVEPNFLNAQSMETIMSKYLGGYTDSKGVYHEGLGQSWYQLYNPSEWWAVNASRLFQEAKNKPELKSWTDKAKAFYNYLIDSVKKIFKGSPTAAVEKGLKAVLNGETLEDREGSQLSASRKLLNIKQKGSIEDRLKSIYDEVKSKESSVTTPAEKQPTKEEVENVPLTDKGNKPELVENTGDKKSETDIAKLDKGDKVYFEGKEHTVLSKVKMGNEWKVQIQNEDKTPFWTNRVENEPAKPEAEEEGKVTPTTDGKVNEEGREKGREILLTEEEGMKEAPPSPETVSEKPVLKQEDVVTGENKTVELSGGYSVSYTSKEMYDGSDGAEVIVTKPNGDVEDLGRMYIEDVADEVNKKIRGYELSRTGKKETQSTTEETEQEEADTKIKEPEPVLKKADKAKQQDSVKMSWPVFSTKYPDVSNDEYQRLRSMAVRERRTSPKLSRFKSKPADRVVQLQGIVMAKLKQAFPNVEVITDKAELEAVLSKDGARQMRTPTGTVYGALYEGRIYLNPDEINPEAPIHEYAHIWIDIARHKFPELYRNVLAQVERTPYFEEAKATYPDLSKQKQLEEAAVQAISEQGVRILEAQMDSSALRRFIDAVKRMGVAVMRFLGVKTYPNFFEMNFDQLINLSAQDLLAASPITYATSEQIQNLDLEAISVGIESGVMDMRKGAVDKYINNWTGKKYEGLIPFLKDMFVSGGQRPTLKNMDDQRQRNISARFQQIQETSYNFRSAIKQWSKGKTDAEVNTALDAIRNYLVKSTDITAINEVPNELKAVVTKMRSDVDGLSQQLLDSGFIDVNTDLHASISSNLGVYMNRSYATFVDPKWLEMMFPEGEPRQPIFEKLYRDAFTYIKNAFNNHVDVIDVHYQLTTDANGNITGVTDAYDNVVTNPAILSEVADAWDAKEKITDDEVDQYLKAFARKDKADAEKAGLKSGKMGKLDLGMFDKKKDVPEVLRAFLGEYTQPEAMYLNSMRKMASYIENQKFLIALKNQGMDKVFFDKPTGAYDQKISDVNEYSPIAGLYTSIPVMNALESGEASVRDKSFKWLYALNAATKIGKTILAPRSQIRNFLANPAIGMANGYYNPFMRKENMVNPFALATQNLLGKGGEVLAELSRLGVIDSSASAKDMETVIKLAFEEKSKLPIEEQSDYTVVTETISNAMRKTGIAASRLYEMGDAIHKIFNYYTELAQVKYMFPDMEESQQKELAGERFRHNNVLYSKTPKIVDKLRRNPIFSSFPSFRAEMLRLSYNIPEQAISDIRDGAESKNARQVAIGVNRLMGYIAAVVGIPLLMQVISSAFGGDDDDDAMLRMTAPDYAKNTTKIIVGKPSQTDIKFIDLSWANPWSYQTDAYNAYVNGRLEGRSRTRALIDGTLEIFKPFMSEEIVVTVAGELYANEDASGGIIYNEETGIADQSVDIMGYIYSKLKPGIISDAERMYKAGVGREEYGRKYDLSDEVVSQLTGAKVYEINLLRKLTSLSFKYKDLFEQDFKIYSTVAKRDSNAPEFKAEVEEAYQKANAQYKKRQQELITYVDMLRKKGVNDTDIYNNLKRVSNQYDRNVWVDGVSLKMLPLMLLSGKTMDLYKYPEK